MPALKIALPKGRLFEESVDLLISKGILKERIEEGRRLILEVNGLKLFLVKPFDVPVYVESGAADLGFCGYDVYLERKPEVYRILDLGIGKCRISVAGKPESLERYGTCSFIKVATKYPRIAKYFFSKKGIKAQVVELSGSVELAPLVGVAEFIVDLVQTGRTLRENGLVEIEKIDDSSAWLICNRASFRNKKEEILEFIRSLEG